MPPNVDELRDLPWNEQIASQVYFLEKQIIQDQQFVHENAFFTLDLNDLTTEMIAGLAGKLKLARRETPFPPDIQVREKAVLPMEEFSLLEDAINRLDWSFRDRFLESQKEKAIL
jgi:hypothetical protein